MIFDDQRGVMETAPSWNNKSQQWEPGKKQKCNNFVDLFFLSQSPIQRFSRK
jgi:hypothetical protein